MVVGGQLGSEGKGHVCAQLALRDLDGQTHAAVRVAGPNAGHTTYDQAGHRFAFRQLPVAAVVNPAARLFIAAGSEVEIEVLRHEIDWAERFGHKVRGRLYIDRQVTILEEAHKQTEAFGQLKKRLGSTQKGIGAARCERLMRRARIGADHGTELAQLGAVCDTAPILRRLLQQDAQVVIEGTQGYGLGLHAGFYPYCTSSDCRAIDFLSMAGLNPSDADQYGVLLVARVYPIRVAGSSGPLRDETSWEALGLPEERTTVTNLVRRVGLWDSELVRDAVAANGGREVVRVVITMLDQMFDQAAGAGELSELIGEPSAWLARVEKEIDCELAAVTVSPTNLIDLGLGL